MFNHYRHFLFAYFCFYPFKSPYSLFNIRVDLANKVSVFNWWQSHSCPSRAIILRSEY